MSWTKIGESNAAGIVDIAACYRRHLPHEVTLPATALKDETAIVEWCIQEFGERGNFKLMAINYPHVRSDILFTEGAIWTSQSRWFHFKNPDHAVMFRMVWG